MIDWELGHDLIWFEVIIYSIGIHDWSGLKSLLIRIEFKIDPDCSHDYWKWGHSLIWFKWLFMRTEVMIDPDCSHDYWKWGHSLIWFKWLFMRTEVMIDPIWSKEVKNAFKIIWWELFLNSLFFVIFQNYLIIFLKIMISCYFKTKIIFK